MKTRNKQQKLNILFITRCYPPAKGGMEKYAYDLHSSLAQKANVKLLKWGGSKKYLPFVLPYFFFRALFYLLFNDVDIIHAQDGVVSVITTPLKYIFKKPMVVIVHGLDITYKNPLYQFLIKKSLRAADRVIAISNDTKDQAGVPVANAPSAFIDNNYYADAIGTSLSTPHVAGLAALIKGVTPGLSSERTRDIIRDNTDKVSAMGGQHFHQEYGYGRINVLKAVRSASSNAAYGNIRLITCDSKNYLVERNIRRKRPINNEAMEQWELTNLYFNKNDRGCDYPTYSLALDRVVKSRDTQKVYLVKDGNAHWLHSKEAAHSWGLGHYESETYPQFDGKSIHFLNVIRELPLYEPNIGDSNIRLFTCGDQQYMVERFIRRKRQLSTYAVDDWSIKNAYFAPDDRGCDYPTYSLELDRVIRSRTTGKEYLVYEGVVYRIDSKEAAVSWGIEEDYENQTYPQFNGKSIHFLPVEYELPPAE